MGGRGFFQDGPELRNPYADDALLKETLGRLLPSDVLDAVQPELLRFGERVLAEIAAFGRDAEAHEPRLITHDPWGRRVDTIETAAGWRALDAVAAEEGLVAEAYERRFGEHSRLVQAAKLYMFHPSSACYTCPLAMTDGAARLLETLAPAALRDGVLPRLTTRDPSRFWTAGQWMTERTGGSDVGGTETSARPEADGDGMYRLYGDKWFTSATTAQVAMTLARIDDGAQTKPGSRGLSLFFLQTRDAHGRPANFEVQRLKDKLGTRALPTAELTLQGTLAQRLGQPGEGVRNIAGLLNITRVYNAICAVSLMRRGLALAVDYAHRRRAFGRPLIDLPLHRETLAGLQLELDAAVLLVFDVVRLLGREECNTASADERALLRGLTPLCKAYTGRQAVAVLSEVIEAFGGAGYVEDTRLPVLLRDAQVLSIWEGTTNVLSLDLLRAASRDDALRPLLAVVASEARVASTTALAPCGQALERALGGLAGHLDRMQSDHELAEASARSLCLSLGRAYTAALMLQRARMRPGQRAEAAARRSCQQLTQPIDADQAWRASSASLLDLG